MTQTNEYAWLAEPTVRDVFMRFPLSIAIIGEAGNVELANELFTQHFDAAVLESNELRSVVRDPDRSWQSICITRRDGHIVDARAQSLRVQNSVMLVVDETAAPHPAPEMDELRERISALEKLSATDHLTGTWNRANLTRSITTEIARSSRLKQPVSLVLLDIDHFKRINDTYGHLAGDSVLREIVAVSTMRIRNADILFRWGGEEFVLLATSTGYRNAEILAESLRKNIEQHTFNVVGSLTISLGVAEHIDSESAEVWFHRVDEALYSAKNRGRNRVVVDRRGNSDTWADQSGRSVLHLLWQEAYECGEPTIDREHRELFDFANTLIDASFSKETSPQVFNVALEKLLGHVVQHFRDDEALLEKRNYARLDAHKAAHAGLVKRALQLKVAALEDKPMLGALVDFLANDVVANHLFTADKDFFPLFRAS